ncbi:thermonuclease family protein [Microcoleus sp. D2_18a_D3]|uniref:thermonuclease family protein n=1 Tax=Microcoleus sp. D2_18a_D3 TaxID=3055330 RepID=UPI002FD173A9
MITPGASYNCFSKFVFDGDTLTLDFRGDELRVRLRWIDTPEAQKPGQNSTDPKILKHWEWAQKAKVALMNLVAEKAIITVPIEKDQFDRWVCDCYLNKVSVATNIQILQCKAGMGVSFLPFNRFAYNTRELSVLRGIITETASANRKKLGLWSEPDLILPNEFKRLTLS